MFMDDTGHECCMRDGYAYDFLDGPEYLHDMPAQRATIRQFQTYPLNLIQGFGRLVCGYYDAVVGTQPGSAFQETQPAQAIQLYAPIDADIIGGGVEFNGLVMQPLVEG